VKRNPKVTNYVPPDAVRQEDKREVELPSSSEHVYVAANADPRAAGYAAAVQAKRRKAALPKHTAKVGGAHVPIPKLDERHQDGLTMSQQATMQRGVAPQAEMRAVAAETAEAIKRQGSVARQDTPTTTIVEMPHDGAMTPQQPQGMPHPASMGILPMDVLPEEATKDKAFVNGYGAMYASAQPQLAMRYGVIRNGQRIPPHKLRGGKDGPAPSLSAKSIQSLETLQKLQQQQRAEAPVDGLHATEEDAERAATSADGPAAASARIGNLPGDTSFKTTSKEASELNVDELDFDKLRQLMMKDILNNDKQKEAIEKRLKPLNVEDLILHNRIEQKVPIVSGFEVTYQSMTGEEDLALKRLIMEESESVTVSDRYLLDKYSIMSVTIGIARINGKPLGEHIGPNGSFSDELFWKKFKRVQKLPTHMLASLGANHFWFECRVRKLFVAEIVGNG